MRADIGVVVVVPAGADRMVTLSVSSVFTSLHVRMLVGQPGPAS